MKFLNLNPGLTKHWLLLFLIACQPESNQEESLFTDRPPNIIFIMADDLGYGDLGSYGQKLIQTPNLDQIAAEGIRFTQAYAGSTVCAPSRSVLMTGQHTGHTRVRGNFAKVGGVPPQGRLPLMAEDTTVAEVLKQAGYINGITGKWGLGEPGSSGIPTRQGFDQWLGYLNQRNAHSYYPEYLWRNQDSLVLEGNLNGQRQVYTHELFTDFALNFIQENKDTTFFLYLPYTIPHDALEVPDQDPYQLREWTEQQKTYAAMVTRMDKDVGMILSLLKELNIDDNTVTFFCSDNGAARRWEDLFNSSGQLKGNKRDMYEGGIRTPMIVRYPGKIKPRLDQNTVWYFADVLPTLADFAGVNPPRNIDGISLYPILMEEEVRLPERFLYWEFYERGFQQAVRWKNWKAVKLSSQADWELYDLSIDISENNDLSGMHPEVLAVIEAYVEIHREDSPHWPNPQGE
ncbi:MAG: arylsulfatase [Candidatus Cyclobacteriaceae bacterium M3_2C_046]